MKNLMTNFLGKRKKPDYKIKEYKANDRIVSFKNGQMLDDCKKIAKALEKVHKAYGGVISVKIIDPSLPVAMFKLGKATMAELVKAVGCDMRGTEDELFCVRTSVDGMWFKAYYQDAHEFQQYMEGEYLGHDKFEE